MPIIKTTKLPTSIPELHAIIGEQSDEIIALKQKYSHMLEQFKLAQQRKFSRSSESNVLQLDLQFDEAEAVPVEALPEEENTISITYTRSKPKRSTLPEDLPREVIEYDIEESEKTCACGWRYSRSSQFSEMYANISM